MTIPQAIGNAISTIGRPASIDEIYKFIIKNNLYSFKAVDPRTVVRSQVRRHCVNIDFPSASKNKLFIEVEQGKYALVTNGENGEILEHSKVDPSIEVDPLEMVAVYHRRHSEEVKKALLEKLLEQSPKFFEKMLIELLLAMGYGQDIGSGHHTGSPGDGGIDGVIYLDKLQTDAIYIQAKLYDKGNKVDAASVHQFVGAMAGIGAKKGVLITTSSFSVPAEKSAEKQTGIKVVLIDGDRLVDLMLAHQIGIMTQSSFQVYEIDEGYFS